MSVGIYKCPCMGVYKCQWVFINVQGYFKVRVFERQSCTRDSHMTLTCTHYMVLILILANLNLTMAIATL